MRGDYQAVLAIAQTVYAAGPEASERARRELVHRHGPDAVRMEGALHGDKAALRVIAGLHDHLAARTVENPDLAHRLRRSGSSATPPSSRRSATP